VGGNYGKSFSFPFLSFSFLFLLVSPLGDTCGVLGMMTVWGLREGQN
jgi:hypothetical protein